jgi:hypothetical protein
MGRNSSGSLAALPTMGGVRPMALRPFLSESLPFNEHFDCKQFWYQRVKGHFLNE